MNAFKMTLWKISCEKFVNEFGVHTVASILNYASTAPLIASYSLNRKDQSHRYGLSKASVNRLKRFKKGKALYNKYLVNNLPW